MHGIDILEKASAHVGERYILGARAPLDNSGWRGPWDCAEYCSWLSYQTYGVVFGCGTKTLRGADPYSGYWASEAENSDRKISVSDAVRTPGAFLIRKPVTAPTNRIGHVAISIGDGRVYEAAGANLGVRIGPVEGRRWDLGVLLPGVEYASHASTSKIEKVADLGKLLILRQQDEPLFDEHVVELQLALKTKGFDPGRVDGQFGPITEAAVYSYQLTEGLLPDGEVGPNTGSALGLPYWETSRGGKKQDTAGAKAIVPETILHDDFGAVVNVSSTFSALKGEYEELFNTCKVQDRKNEIAALARRIASNRERYERLVSSFRDKPGEAMPWYFVALMHAMEASGDIGLFRTHLHNGDPLVRPTVHVPKDRPSKTGTNFSWEASARDALEIKGYDGQSDWSLAKMLNLLEKYNGFGPRSKGHATAYLWSYSNHYKRGKYIADRVWSDDAVSKQPGAATILKQLVDDGVVAL